MNAHPKIGSQTIKKVIALYPDLSELWNEKSSLLLLKLGEKNAVLVGEVIRDYNPEEQIEKLFKNNIGYMTMYDNDYPKQLSQIYDSPVILYIKGNLQTLSGTCLGVVGSRKYTEYGRNCAHTFSYDCAKAGLVIVSGLALGIDAFAHQACIDAQGKTLGVLGCGLDKVYPISNLSLGREIVDRGGALISEFPIGTPPMKQNFPARNRIIAGLSKGLLVVEARIGSGALITAYQALEYNRDIFAIPGEIYNESSLGANKLIQDGAKLVTSADDILNEFNLTTALATQKEVSLAAGSNEELIYSLLKNGERLVNDIVVESKLNIIAVNTSLTLLEMQGIIKNLGGGKFIAIS